MGFFKSVSNTLGTAATGGAWSPDGKSGLMQGGNGLLDVLPDGMKSMIPGIGDAMATNEANRFNAQMAKNQMDFQERMSNSSYQRAMADMKKAGLNPMLAMSQGGASTPAGASATASPASKTKLAEFAMNAATGLNTARTQTALANNTLQDSVQNRQLQQSQTAKNIADAQAIQIDAKLKERELKNPRFMENMSRKATGVINDLMEKVNNSAKSGSAWFSGPGGKDVKILPFDSRNPNGPTHNTKPH